MQACPICVRDVIDSPFEAAVGMCSACATTFGVVPMLPARRPARPCDRCNGMQFIRAIPRELTSATVGEHNYRIAAPMPVTFQHYALDIEILWTTHRTAQPIDSRRGFGYLEQYICRKCGFVEWYCIDPERIPIGPGYMTEAIDYGADDTPYRG